MTSIASSLLTALHVLRSDTPKTTQVEQTIDTIAQLSRDVAAAKSAQAAADTQGINPAASPTRKQAASALQDLWMANLPISQMPPEYFQERADYEGDRDSRIAADQKLAKKTLENIRKGQEEDAIRKQNPPRSESFVYEISGQFAYNFVDAINAYNSDLKQTREIPKLLEKLQDKLRHTDDTATAERLQKQIDVNNQVIERIKTDLPKFDREIQIAVKAYKEKFDVTGEPVIKNKSDLYDIGFFTAKIREFGYVYEANLTGTAITRHSYNGTVFDSKSMSFRRAEFGY